jgi:rhodanese-related sulfurtransferase
MQRTRRIVGCNEIGCGCLRRTDRIHANNRFNEGSYVFHGGLMSGTTQGMPEISATELKRRLDNGEGIQIIDVREANEVAVAKIPNSIHIPLAQVLNRMSEIDPARETVVHCKLGGRSARAIEALKRSGFRGNLLNLTGGITAWSNEVDPTVPKY